jgi:hypothetical protein
MQIQMGDAEDSGVSGRQGLGTAVGGTISNGISRLKEADDAAAARTSPMGSRWLGFVEREYLLAETGRGNGRWNRGQLEMA